MVGLHLSVPHSPAFQRQSTLIGWRSFMVRHPRDTCKVTRILLRCACSPTKPKAAGPVRRHGRIRL